MSKKERLKVRLDFLKTLIFTCLVAIFGVVGYVAINFDNISFRLGVFVAIGFVLLCSVIYFANKSFDKKLDELEEME